ncbi:hypothetical protein RWE39_004378 [Salmonella enterica]|nr:hypothetical protein [Salmonella enterica]
MKKLILPLVVIAGMFTIGAAVAHKTPSKKDCEYLNGLVSVEGIKGMSEDQMDVYNACHPGSNVHWQKSENGLVEAVDSLDAVISYPAVKNKPFSKRVGDVQIKRDRLGIVTIDGKPAAPIEATESEVSYQAGIFTAVIYYNGKVALMRNNVFEDFAK